MPHKLLLLNFLIGTLTGTQAICQHNRINTHGTLGWYNVFATKSINDKFSIHTEYQWRRNDFITQPKQSLLRIGGNYHIKPTILLRLGYAWIETFNYGEIPINVFGKDFTEHRIFQMIQFSHREGILGLSHRFMLEQRFIGRYSSPELTREDEFVFTNRARYMFRGQVPLKGRTIEDKTPYVAAYDEIFIGFGKNVQANVFDQNRFGILLGCRFHKKFSIEGGFLNQILQFGRLIDGKNVFQTNNGLIVNSLISF